MRATSVTEKAGSSTSASHSFRSFAPSRIVPHRLPFFHYRAPADDGAALIMFVCVFITRDKVRINIIYIYAIVCISQTYHSSAHNTKHYKCPPSIIYVYCIHIYGNSRTFTTHIEKCNYTLHICLYTAYMRKF